MLGLLGLALRLGGNAYHKTGEATAKALSPVVLADLISGLARVLLPTDLRLYLDCLTDFTSQVLTNSPNCTISLIVLADSKTGGSKLHQVVKPVEEVETYLLQAVMHVQSMMTTRLLL